MANLMSTEILGNWKKRIWRGPEGTFVRHDNLVTGLMDWRAHWKR